MELLERLSKEKVIVGAMFLVVLLLLLHLFFIHQGGLLLWDEPVYLANSKDILSTSFFTEDFRFPLLPYFIAGVWFFTGESILAAQLLVVLFTLLTVFIFYKLTKFFFPEEKYRLLATFLFAFSYPIIFWGFRIYADIPAVFFALLSVYLFFLSDILAIEKRPKIKAFLFFSGVFAGLAFLMRYSVILIPGIIGIFIIYKKQFKSLLYFVLGGFIAILPWLIGNYLIYGNIMGGLLAQANIISDYTFYQSPLILLKSMLEMFSFSLIFLIGFFLLIVREGKRNHNIWIILTIFLTNLFYHLFFVNLKLARYVLVLLPFIVLMIVLGFKEIIELEKYKKNNVISGIFLALLIIPIIFSGIFTIMEINSYNLCTKNGAIMNSVEYIVENTMEGDRIISNSWIHYGYYGNLRAGSIWTDDIDFLINNLDPKYFIIIKYEDLEISKEVFDESQLLNLEKEFIDECGKEVYIYKNNLYSQ
ncbi:MAG: glycosyltransferase family 39 protein [Candidatus Pacearchaeota archaeon]